jgi:hypothetical protein
MGKRRRARNTRSGLNTPYRPSQTSALCNNKAGSKGSKGDHGYHDSVKDGRPRSDRPNGRLHSDPGRLQTTMQGHRSLPRSSNPPKIGKQATSSPAPSLKNLFDHKYDRVIRDVVIHGTVLAEKLRILIDNLTKIKSDPEDMEWEITNTTYLVPEQPPCLKDVSFAKISSQASYRPPRP